MNVTRSQPRRHEERDQFGKVAESGMFLLVKRRGMDIVRKLQGSEITGADEMRELAQELSVLLQSSEAGRLTMIQVDYPPLPRAGRAQAEYRITTLYSALVDCSAHIAERLAAPG
ncbi:MAG TPA: hypothetical protein VLD37_03970 [Candidatus Bilamarchaeum sp.]|nr:hypothetical protein [Candidatus Bilamarchaeum sp.]